MTINFNFNYIENLLLIHSTHDKYKLQIIELPTYKNIKQKYEMTPLAFWKLGSKG